MSLVRYIQINMLHPELQPLIKRYKYFLKMYVFSTNTMYTDHRWSLIALNLHNKMRTECLWNWQRIDTMVLPSNCY